MFRSKWRTSALMSLDTSFQASSESSINNIFFQNEPKTNIFFNCSFTKTCYTRAFFVMHWFKGTARYTHPNTDTHLFLTQFPKALMYLTEISFSNFSLLLNYNIRSVNVHTLASFSKAFICFSTQVNFSPCVHLSHCRKKSLEAWEVL